MSGPDPAFAASQSSQSSLSGRFPLQSGVGFTPGPWLVGTGSGGGATTYVYEDDGSGQQCRAIAACTLEFVERPMAEREANARLIRAAPDMLAALCAVKAYHIDANPTKLTDATVCDLVCGALAKARGEQ